MACKLVYLPHQRIIHRKIGDTFKLRAYCTSKNDKTAKLQDSSEVTKESLHWRSPWDQRQGEWYSKLKVFASDQNNTDIIKFLQSPIDLRPSTIINWYKRKVEETERHMQQFIPERNKILGDNLAAAHFIIYRGGSVKFHGDSKWITQDENLEYKLPNKFVPQLVVQAIDCSKVNLYYEGLANFRGLKKLEWLNLNGCREMDDWCMDRISGTFKDSLLYLDVRNCKKITDRGIGALYKLTKLNTLLVDNVTETKALELTCLMLQELSPTLDIRCQ